ncbi:spore gernimation protein [Paenibacillus sp. BIHB 4019]|uniref:Spore gernimation protein n=1 Tax=Paenibacillus sp. BIHB 4019 TaxID=1870819 RepID=A0A1B2DQF9_9BACL|nr:endospore germination permease [Paenibacillus sp. BIHB 4019]ANY69929.1 spore gernimation protein [Paenibacillus sp. BIHB 4019]
MLEKGKISARQLTVLVFLSVIGDMILIIPAVVASYAQQDGWIASLLGMPIGMFFLWLMLHISSFYPKLNLVQINDRILGKWLGALMSCAYLLFFLLAGSTFIREVGDFLTTQLFQTTPIRYIHLLFVLILLWGVWNGIESIARSAEILLPLFLFICLVLIVCLIPQIDLERLKPFLGSERLSFAHATLMASVYPFGELCSFLMIYPYAAKPSHRQKDVLLSALCAALLLFSLVFISLTVLGAYFTEHNIYSTYLLTQKINIGAFLQRIEALMATAWVISTFFKTALFFYAFAVGTAQLLRLSTAKPLIIPTSFLMYGLAMMVAPNLLYYVKTIVPYWIDWDFTYAFVLPMLLIVVYYMKKKLKRG